MEDEEVLGWVATGSGNLLTLATGYTFELKKPLPGRDERAVRADGGDAHGAADAELHLRLPVDGRYQERASRAR